MVAGTLIMNSITAELRRLIVSDVGPNPEGPLVLCKIVNKLQKSSSNAVRKLETELRSLDLRAEPDENV